MKLSIFYMTCLMLILLSCHQEKPKDNKQPATKAEKNSWLD